MKSASEISKKREEINRYLDTIEEYVAKQPNELSKLKEDYLSIYNDIVGLTPQRTVKTYAGPIKDGGKKDNPEVNDWIKAIKPYIPKILVGVAILAIVLCFILWPRGEVTQAVTGRVDTTTVTEEPGTDAPPIPFDDATFSSLLSKCDFTEAWKMLQQLEDSDKKNNLIRTLLNAYKGWLQMDLSMKENDLPKLLELRQKLLEYSAFNNEYESDLQLLDEGYIKPLEEKQAKAEERERKARESARHRDQNLDSGDSAGGTAAKKKVNSDGVVRIFNSDTSWRQGTPVSGSIISCQSKSHFIITGAKLTKADAGIEVAPQGDGTIRIRANNAGQYKVTLDKMTLTFNVSR